MTNKQLAKIYRNAAKNLQGKEWKAYCCNAIQEELIVSSAHDETFALDTFASIMGHPKDVYITEKRALDDPIFHGWFGPPTPKAQEARRIALCLAAAVVESGGL